MRIKRCSQKIYKIKIKSIMPTIVVAESNSFLASPLVARSQFSEAELVGALQLNEVVFSDPERGDIKGCAD
jgi:hypothetical protein